MKESWVAPEPETDSEFVTVDPRVDASHVVGQLPCPSNPAPPQGWRYWKGAVSPALGALASKILHDAQTYPMGAFVQKFVDGELIAARVEWHDLQGASGRKGCFRGVNLMRRQSQAAIDLSE